MIIQYESFKDWFEENLYEYAKNIVFHGADSGYLGYISDTAKIFDRFADEIWDMAVEDAEDMGYKNVAAMIAEFGRSDMFSDFDCFKNLMVWFACEKLAKQIVDNQ